MLFNIEAYRLAVKRAQALIAEQDESDEITFLDSEGNISSTNVASALSELGEQIHDKHLVVTTGERPGTVEELYEGLAIFDTTEGKPYWCVTPGTKEVDTLVVESGTVLSGSPVITLNGVDVVVDVIGDVGAAYELVIDTGATATGDITLTLDDEDFPIGVTAEDTAEMVATSIAAEFSTSADWIVIANVDTVTISATVAGPKTGDFSFDGGETGVSSTLGVTVTAEGHIADTDEQVAAKFREATYTGWTLSGTGLTLIFTKNELGTCSAPAFDTGGSGVAATFTRTNVGTVTTWLTLPVLELPELTYIGVNEETDEFLCDLDGEREIKFSMSMTNSGSKAVSFTNWPLSGRCEVFLEVTASAAPTVSWNLSGGTVRWPGSTAPSIQSGKVYRIMFFTADGGTNWDGYLLGRDNNGYIVVADAEDTFACDVDKEPMKKFALAIADTNAKIVTFSNVPTGRCEVELEITTSAVASVTWTLDGGTVAWLGGFAPTLESGKVYLIGFRTSDSGTTWDGYPTAGV